MGETAVYRGSVGRDFRKISKKNRQALKIALACFNGKFTLS